MELLEKESFYYNFNDRLIEPVECAFFTEENYKGYASHQEAVLAYLTYMNRKWSIQVPQLVPGLKQKLDQVPDVEITLTPEIKQAIEMRVDAQIKADMITKEATGFPIYGEPVQQYRARIIRERIGYRKGWEADVKQFPQLYKLTADVKLTYMDVPSFDSYNGFPVRVNPQMMQAVAITPENFFAEDGEYESAFLSYMGTQRTRKDFWKVNDLLFPDKKNLVIYQWNNDFTNIYNDGREDDGAFLWSVYDPENKQFTVMDIVLIID